MSSFPALECIHSHNSYGFEFNRYHHTMLSDRARSKAHVLELKLQSLLITLGDRQWTRPWQVLHVYHIKWPKSHGVKLRPYIWLKGRIMKIKHIIRNRQCRWGKNLDQENQIFCTIHTAISHNNYIILQKIVLLRSCHKLKSKPCYDTSINDIFYVQVINIDL